MTFCSQAQGQRRKAGDDRTEGRRHLTGFGAFSCSITHTHMCPFRSVAHPHPACDQVLELATAQLALYHRASSHPTAVNHQLSQSASQSGDGRSALRSSKESSPPVLSTYLCDDFERTPCNMSQHTETGESAVQSQNSRTVRPLPWKTLRRRNFLSTLAAPPTASSSTAHRT